MNTQQKIFGVTRLALGLIFLWAFIDKVVGLGFTTCRDVKTEVVTVWCDKAWLMGGSPTTGFLKFGTDGIFSDTFQLLAGSSVVDWLFMAGLLGIGLSLTLGVVVRFASVAGVVLFSLMYLAVVPPEHHPFIDEHVIYALIFLSFLTMPVGDWFGFGKQWARLSFVKRSFWLQ